MPDAPRCRSKTNRRRGRPRPRTDVAPVAVSRSFRCCMRACSANSSTPSRSHDHGRPRRHPSPRARAPPSHRSASSCVLPASSGLLYQRDASDARAVKVFLLVAAFVAACAASRTCPCGQSFDRDPLDPESDFSVGADHDASAHCYCRCGDGPEERFPPSQTCSGFEGSCELPNGTPAQRTCN